MARNAGEGAKAAGPVTAQPRSDDEWWEASLCSRIDAAELATASGYGKLERGIGNAFDVGVPPMRVCHLSEVGADAADAAQLQAALRVVAEAADGFESEPQQVIEACAVADDQAAALLGTEPTVRLDFFHPKFGVPNCIRATETAGIRVSARPAQNAADWQDGGDEAVDLGRAGSIYYEGDDVYIVSWASPGNDHDVTMEFVEGQHVTKDAALALGEALQDLY